jgi:group I intron endonuclease
MAREIIIGIYMLKSPSNKVYIGQSKDIYRRFRYYHQLNCKKQSSLYNSLIKYGAENHTFDIIEKCDVYRLNERERYWQEYYDACGKNGLNCRLTQTDDKSALISEKTRQKMSESGKAKVMSKEHRDNLIKSGLKRRGRKGIPHTEERKAIIRQQVIERGSWNGDNNPNRKNPRKGELNHMFGKKHSASTISKLCEVQQRLSKQTGERFSKLNSMDGNGAAKEVLCLENGIYYGCVKQAWLAYGNLAYSTFVKKVRENRTSFIYV